MSRSRRKHPIFGNSNADSEASDKRIWHSRMRHRERQALHSAVDFDAHLTTVRNDVSSTWNMAKDGKSYFFEADREGAASWISESRGKTDLERATIKRRLMRRLMAK